MKPTSKNEANLVSENVNEGSECGMCKALGSPVLLKTRKRGRRKMRRRKKK